jgi:hypothetical protein
VWEVKPGCVGSVALHRSQVKARHPSCRSTMRTRQRCPRSLSDMQRRCGRSGPVASGVASPDLHASRRHGSTTPRPAPRAGAHTTRCMTCRPTNPRVGWSKASGTVASTVEAEPAPERDGQLVRLVDGVELNRTEARSSNCDASTAATVTTTRKLTKQLHRAPRARPRLPRTVSLRDVQRPRGRYHINR